MQSAAFVFLRNLPQNKITMKQLIANFSKHLTEAISIGESAILHQPPYSIKNILISGLGGSGIGGTIVSQIVSGEARVPITVSKDYFIPAFVDGNTVVIICSYSGNTEETLSAMKFAMEKKAKIVCISSGGEVVEIAKKNGLDFILIPPGFPPRSAFAFPFVQLFYVLGFFKIISSNVIKDIKSAIDLIETEEGKILEEAKNIAGKLLNKIPVIYSDASIEGVSVRFRQQINENSKMLCWHHAIPEMNHNELVGWVEKNENLAVVILRNGSDYSRSQKRMEINKEIISKKTSTVVEIHSKGNSKIENALYLIHLCDWVSQFLADLKNIDSTEVKVIDFLKGELAKI